MFTATMDGCIVEEWLRTLGLVHYTQAFLDNGYDDLEVCKQIGCPDLDAIGVANAGERAEVLAAVKQLLEEGGTRVYFTLDPDYHSPNGLLSPSVVGAEAGPSSTCGGSGESGGGAAPAGVTTTTPHPYGANGGGAGIRYSSTDHNNGLSIEDYDEAEEYEVKPGGGGLRGPPLPPGPGGAKHGDAYDVGRAALVTFPRIQLAAIVRDRAEEDGIDLAELYQPGQQVDLGGALDELTKRYSVELKTHYHHVLEALRFQAEMAATMYDQDLYSTEPDDVGFSMFSVAGHSHRSVPPPLPSCPPPSTSFADGTVLEGTKMSPHHTNRSPVHADPNCHGNEELADLADGESTLKKRTGLGRFFKNMGVRRSGRKYVYKQHAGDLHASQITMPDEERIELMLLVKEGKLSMHDAVETVKHYENWKRRQLAMEQTTFGDQDSPLLDVPPPPPTTHPHDNHHQLQHFRSSPNKVKKVTFSLPLFKLPTLRRKSMLTKQKSLSSAESPMRGRTYALSGSDYCEPPVEISPDEEAFPGIPIFRSETTRPRHKKSTDVSDPSHVSTYSPSQWISPMLLRRYIKNDSKTDAGGTPGAREQRRGLFSSPFIKRKGSLDSKVPARGGGGVGIMGGTLRTSGSFGGSEGDGRSAKGHRGILHSSSLAFGSRESLREHLRGSRSSALTTFGEVPTSATSSSSPVATNLPSRETVTIATVHATDCPEDDPMDTGTSRGADDVDDGVVVTALRCGRSPPEGSGTHCAGAPTGGNHTRTHPVNNETMNRNLNGHHHHHHHHHNHSNRGAPPANGDHPNNPNRRPAPTCDSSSLRIEACMVCNKNEENLKADLSAGDSGTARDSPDIGIEDTSPTGTLDSTASEDFKDSKYGSSSTMSVGSDVSPITERRTGKKAAIKPSKLQQHHTNSAGEECMSSDYEDQEDISLKTTTRRSSALVKDVCTCKETLTPSSSPRHLPSSPSTLSETSHDTDSIIYSPRRHKSGRKSSKRPRPKTVDELLGRLGIQHLLNVFLMHGYQSLELFAELEEEDLDELCITQPEDRAKILTAAQLLLDYEGSSHDPSVFLPDTNSLASSQSQSGISSCDSQHDSLLANTLPAVKTVPTAGVHSGSSSDELNLQHATISDQESSGEGDEGTLKAVSILNPTDSQNTGGTAPRNTSDRGPRNTSDRDTTRDRHHRITTTDRQPSRNTTSDREHRSTSDNENNLMMISTNNQDNHHTSHSRSPLLSSSQQDNAVTTTSDQSVTLSNNSGAPQDVLSVPDVVKVKLRMSTGTCTSPNLGRRSLTDSSDGDVSKKSQSSDSAVSSDMDSSSSSPLRRRAVETSDETTSSTSPARNKAQRASTGSGLLVKPPKPQVPVRTVSLPATSSATGTGTGLNSFRSAQEVAAPASKGGSGGSATSGSDSNKQVPAVRLGKISHVRDKV